MLVVSCILLKGKVIKFVKQGVPQAVLYTQVSIKTVYPAYLVKTTNLLIETTNSAQASVPLALTTSLALVLPVEDQSVISSNRTSSKLIK